jgi:CBS domain-containing protein
MTAERNLTDMMRTPDNVIGVADSARSTLQQFKLETVRSLIVLSDNMPVGVITRERVFKLTEPELDLPVREFMTATPIATHDTDMTIARESIQSAEFDIDSLPVVDAGGALIGVVDRSVLIHEGDVQRANAGTVQMRRSDGLEGSWVELSAGSEVRGSEDEKLGELDELLIENGRVTALFIKHGLLGRHHKRVGADHVARVDGDTVYLDFGKLEFKHLADVESADVQLS